MNLAAKSSGEIVNCDSLQLYRGFDAGAAKIPASEHGRIPHHLFDVLEASAGYSAGGLASRCGQYRTSILHVPVLCGGGVRRLRKTLESPAGHHLRQGTRAGGIYHGPYSIFDWFTRIDEPARCNCLTLDAPDARYPVGFLRNHRSHRRGRRGEP